MIDLLTGKIECNRFRSEQNDEMETFRKKFIANNIQNLTHNFNGCEMNIGDFVLEHASVMFRPNGKIEGTVLVFTTESGNCATDAGIQQIINDLSNNYMLVDEPMLKSWKMPYGMISIMWSVWPDGKQFMLQIQYNHWDVQFTTWNKWHDIVWSFTKTQPMESFCVYRDAVRNENETHIHENIKLYSTHNRCLDCAQNCRYSKLWYSHNTPTYKELEKYFSEETVEIDEAEYNLKPIHMKGICGNSLFKLTYENNQYTLNFDGFYYDFTTFLEEIDKTAKITSSWYSKED
jgi:hypothetical protein